jgi:hypothetical protein
MNSLQSEGMGTFEIIGHAAVDLQCSKIRLRERVRKVVRSKGIKE